MLADDVGALRDVNAIQLVACHERLNPLDVRSELMEDGVRFRRDRGDLVESQLVRTRHGPLNQVLVRHCVFLLLPRDA
jgi:hypothetical protein